MNRWLGSKIQIDLMLENQKLKKKDRQGIWEVKWISDILPLLSKNYPTPREGINGEVFCLFSGVGGKFASIQTEGKKKCFKRELLSSSPLSSQFTFLLLPPLTSSLLTSRVFVEALLLSAPFFQFALSTLLVLKLRCLSIKFCVLLSPQFLVLSIHLNIIFSLRTEPSLQPKNTKSIETLSLGRIPSIFLFMRLWAVKIKKKNYLQTSCIICQHTF